jgi:hypothetical protein
MVMGHVCVLVTLSCVAGSLSGDGPQVLDLEKSLEEAGAANALLIFKWDD